MQECKIIENLMKKTILFALSTLFLLFISSCYYDNEEELYQFVNKNCDTTNVTYSLTIAPIIQSSCNSCHSSSVASGGIITDNYTNLRTIALNGKLTGTVSHSAGYSPMPKGAGKLSDCKISQISKWVNNGALNN